LNTLHKLIQDKGLSDKLKLVGLAAGNSPFEVNVFKEKYAITFPLLPDKDFTAHKALGQVGTPFYYVLKREGTGFAIVDARLGRVSSPQAFLDEVIAKTSLAHDTLSFCPPAASDFALYFGHVPKSTLPHTRLIFLAGEQKS
jgi:hypothetical protein